jgi:hypothetical protein
VYLPRETPEESSIEDLEQDEASTSIISADSGVSLVQFKMIHTLNTLG